MALPLFFQYDDVDFSLRVKDIPKITMCGISVWHHYLKFHSVNRTYYSARNMLTIAAVNGRFNTRLVRNIFFFIMTNIGCYRYSSAEAQLQAIYDFRKGPVKVFDAITEDYSRFEEYKFEDPVEMEDLITKVIKHCRPFYYITLNGIIFPSIGNIKADMESYETYEFYRKGKAYYFSPDGKMMVSDRSRKKIITLSVRTAVSMMALLLRKRHINKIYSKASRFYSSEENWMRLCNSGKK